VLFAVWAPNARRVSVVGDFNQWDGRRCQMRKRFDSGLWEIFAPTSARARSTNTRSSARRRAAAAEGRPVRLRGRAAALHRLGRRRHRRFLLDRRRAYIKRREGEPRRKPMSIYEVHLGSWRRGEDGRFLTYDELADALIPYVVDLGFTHIELMPITEHPLDDLLGLSADRPVRADRRFGAPAGFARFVDRAHAAGLGVILDWVPAHFPTDAHGLAHFDGTALYEHADPRKGFHPDWNTAIYDFGRKRGRQLPARPTRSTGSTASTSTGCASTRSPRCSTSTIRAARANGCPTPTAATRTATRSPS
jgi:1,4-alpha-glucan branching enzyme